MLLRNNQQVALNEVETLCFEAADHYATAANKTVDPELSHLFAALAEQREQFAAELAAHIRALDDLPQQPDPDKETIDALLTSVKAFFSVDERNTLIAEREQHEQKIADAVNAALREDLAEETKALLGQMLSHVENAIRRLEEARPR